MKKNLVILTGAGISAESGIKTFRDSNGLWENHPIEDVATPEAFHRNPALVYEFYNLRRAQLLEENVKPNLAHKSMANFQKESSKYTTHLITQNVDNLHERAGAKAIHMHGELQKARCSKTNNVFNWQDSFDENTNCPCCKQTGNLRPHIVWFGEMPLSMDEIYKLLEEADIFAAIGTSAQVYPAAMFYQIAKQSGAKTVELNLEKTGASLDFDLSINGKATEIVPKFLDDLEKEKLNFKD